MRRLIIFGAGDLARVAWWYFSEDSNYRVEAFTVDRPFFKEDTLLNLPVVPFDEAVTQFRPAEFDGFVAMGFGRLNRARAEAYDRLKQHGYRMASYVSSQARNTGKVTPGDNCFILEDNVLQPFVSIGNNVTLWSGNHIGHDAAVDDHCFISSHVVLSGRVHVGARSFIGVNATVKQNVKIGPDCLIGAGAVILKDTAPGSVHIVKHTPVLPVSSSVVGELL